MIIAHCAASFGRRITMAEPGKACKLCTTAGFIASGLADTRMNPPATRVSRPGGGRIDNMEGRWRNQRPSRCVIRSESNRPALDARWDQIGGKPIHESTRIIPRDQASRRGRSTAGSGMDLARDVGGCRAPHVWSGGTGGVDRYPCRGPDATDAGPGEPAGRFHTVRAARSDGATGPNAASPADAYAGPAKPKPGSGPIKLGVRPGCRNRTGCPGRARARPGLHLW